MKTYDGLSVENWRNGLESTVGPNARYALAMFALFGIPESYLDVGCGLGAMVEVAFRLGVADPLGLDQLVSGDELRWLRHQDLRERFDVGRKFKVVTCIEVAEHIPRQYCDGFLDSLAAHVALGGVMVFTSPQPGLEGLNPRHVNCRPPGDWRGDLFLRNLTYSHYLTLQLGAVWNGIWAPLSWLPATLQVFTYGTAVLPSGVGQ